MSLVDYDAEIHTYEEAIRLSKILYYPLVVSHSFVLDTAKIKTIFNYFEFIDYAGKIECISPEQPLLLSGISKK